jgi:hypothetical protein
MWQQHVRLDSARRLHLAARSSETLLFMFRPLAASRDSSPAELRLTLRPAVTGIIGKRSICTVASFRAARAIIKGNRNKD